MAAPLIRLGVDFGTSNTVAVVRWPDGRARPLLFDGSPLLPSAVYAEPAGGLVVGRDAVHSARLDPSRFEPNPKRRIDDGTVLLGDHEFPIGELITAVLKRVAEEWRRTAGAGPAEVTLTCPASWGATRRLVLADAATEAGLGEIRLVAEPVAAATYFTQVLGRDVPIGSVVVVHDFGAGTFDASVVARTSSGFEVLAVDGRDDIGGLDVDEAAVSHLGVGCVERDAKGWQRLVSPETVEDRRARRLLWDDVRVAKERLSRSTSADLTVPIVGVDVHLTRDELETLAQPLIEATVRVTQGVMRWARLADGRLAGVFLVGGSSRIPLVATLLHRAIGEAPVVIEQPELVVAEGSVLAGAVAVPVSAAPAPGPATGEHPRITLDLANGVTILAGGDNASTVAYVAPVSPAPARPISPGSIASAPVSPASASSALTAQVPVSGGPTRSQPGPAVGPTQALPTHAMRQPGATRALPQPEAGRSDQVYAAGRASYPPQPYQSPVYQPQPYQPPPRTTASYQPSYQPSPGLPAYAAEDTAEEYDDYDYARAGAGEFGRILRTIVLTILLIAVPLVSAYAAYRITVRLGG